MASPNDDSMLLVTSTTSDLLSFAQNWLCSVASARVRAPVRVVSLSAGVCEALSSFQRASPHQCVKSPVTDHTIGSRVRDAAVVYDTESYRSGVRLKLSVFHEILRGIVRGGTGSDDRVGESGKPMWILFSDVDVVFFSDPFAYFLLHHRNETRVLFSLNDCRHSTNTSGKTRTHANMHEDGI